MKELANLKRLMKEHGLIANTGNTADNLEIIPLSNLMRPGFTGHNGGETNVCDACDCGCANGCGDGCHPGCPDGCKLGCKDGYL